MEKKFNLNDNNQIPPFIVFGAFEKTQEVAESQNEIVEYYDYNTQKTIYPFFCGSSDRKVTRSAKNVGSKLRPQYKNVTDDAAEK